MVTVGIIGYVGYEFYNARLQMDAERSAMYEAGERYRKQELPELVDRIESEIANPDEYGAPGQVAILCTENDVRILTDIKPFLDDKEYSVIVAVRSFGAGYLSASEIKQLQDEGWYVCLTDGYEKLEDELLDAGITLCDYSFSPRSRAMLGPKIIPVGGSMESGCKNRIYSAMRNSTTVVLGVGYSDTLDTYKESNVESMLKFLEGNILEEKLAHWNPLETD